MRLLESANGNVDTIISYCVDIESEISESEGYLKAMEIETKSMISVIDKKNSQQKVLINYMILSSLVFIIIIIIHHNYHNLQIHHNHNHHHYHYY